MGQTVRCRTKNLDHVKVMQVEEWVHFKQTPEGCVNCQLMLHSLKSLQEDIAGDRSQDSIWLWVGSDEKD